MSDPIIRPAFSTWPTVNQRLRDTVAALTPEQLAMRPAPDRWPLWATVGHLACQRVFWLPRIISPAIRLLDTRPLNSSVSLPS